MRPRTEALAAVLLLGVLATIGTLLGRATGEVPDTDSRPSTFLAGPAGSRGLLEASRRLGIAVRRFRERPVHLEPGADSARRMLVILDPSAPFSPPEVGAVLRFASRADLLLAGAGAGTVIRCFGYRVERRLDTAQVLPDAFVSSVLVRSGEGVAVDSSRVEDVGRFACRIPEVREREVLLRTSRGDVAAVRLRLTNGHEVLLFGDVAPFRNRNLRRTSAGPFVLGLFAGRYDQIVFEEYHHGFGASGSLGGAALAWSRRSPWGWAVWQVAVVGVLALLFGAVRFGPARRVITRARRSPLEHVRALATALSAAGGHDEAIGAMVRGLRRRLAPAGFAPAGDWRPWLDRLAVSAGSPRAREALGRLQALARPGQASHHVRLAALAVEDLWQELKP
jgi:hypothetical protein